MDGEVLKGRHYFLARYKGRSDKSRRTKLFQTGIIRSKKGLLSRSKDGKTIVKAPSREKISLIELLSMHTRISGYANLGNEVATDIDVIPLMKLQGYLRGPALEKMDLVKSRPNRDLYITKTLDIR